jgi:hypothetical protein
MTKTTFIDGSAARAARAKEIQASLWAKHLALKAAMAAPIAPAAKAAPKAKAEPKAKAAPILRQGANLRVALGVARSIGCVIRAMPGTDDCMVTHPDHDGAVQVKVTRKDATRELVALVRRVHAGRYAKVA